MGLSLGTVAIPPALRLLVETFRPNGWRMASGVGEIVDATNVAILH